MLLNVFCLGFTSKKMVDQIVQFGRIDSQLKGMNLNSHFDKSERRVRRHLVVLLVLVNLIFNIFGEVASALVRDTNQILFFFVNVYPRMMIGFMTCTLNSIFLLGQTRFEMINELVSRKIENSRKCVNYPNEANFCNEIQSLVEIHKILVRTCKEINSIFLVQVLVCITMDFVLLIGDLHTSMYIIFFDLFYKHFKIVLDMIKNCVTYVFDLVYLAKRTNDLCNEANRTKILLLGIDVDIDKESERNVVS